MAIIPTVDVIVNSNSDVETAQSGRGMTSVMPTGSRNKLVYGPTLLSDEVEVLSSGDIIAIEALYTNRFEAIPE